MCPYKHVHLCVRSRHSSLTSADGARDPDSRHSCWPRPRGDPCPHPCQTTCTHASTHPCPHPCQTTCTHASTHPCTHPCQTTCTHASTHPCPHPCQTTCTHASTHPCTPQSRISEDSPPQTHATMYLHACMDTQTPARDTHLRLFTQTKRMPSWSVLLARPGHLDGTIR